jgi:hypothetical protein
MNVKFLSKAVATAVGLSVLLTAPAGAFAPDATEKSADSSNRRVCRSLVPSGTRFAARVCKTQAEWDLAQDKTQREALKQQINGRGGAEVPEPPPR